MLRFVKQTIWLLGILIGCQSAFGFALVGPAPEAGSPDVFEVPVIAYRLGGLTVNGTVVDSIAGYPGNDIGTPKNIDEGYRRNTPVMYYAFDQSFLGFFGADGAAEVDKAMAIFNGVGDVSSYSADLSEFPLDSRRVNFRAAADSLLDIKSVTMGLMIEQLGPWQPTRWVWALHSRAGTPCPAGMFYDVIKRNFDIVPSGKDSYQNSSYVNGVLYSYFIQEFCTGPNPLADAIEFPVDPLTSPYSAVADFDSFWYRGLSLGTFYTSLTRDDVGGLRYLMRTNNFWPEAAGGRTIEFVTNAPAFIQTQDLGVLAAAARTNDPVTLAGLFPGLIVTSTITNFFNFAITTNITAALINFPTDPAGSAPSHPVFSTNYTTNLLTTYQHTFGNVVTNSFATHGVIGVLTLSLQSAPFSPAGFVITTNGLVTIKPLPINGVFGDFFILPTNLCSAQVLSNLLTQVTATTNLPTATIGTVTNGIVFTPGSITFATNHFVAYLPVSCPVDSVGMRGGVEKVRFIRRDYDPLVGQAWNPVTNDYTVVELVTNNVKVLRHFQRAVPKPDFLFTATDLAVSTAFTYSNTVDNATESLTITITGSGKFDAFRTMNFDGTHRPGNQAGPGTIVTPDVLPTLIVFNKIGPLYQNSFAQGSLGASGFIDETTQIPDFAVTWASFDGSTNAPEIYPNGASVVALENLLTGPVITTRSLPNGSIGAPYSAQLAAGGGHGGPYTWTLAPGSPSLPDGLNLSSTGKITGTPDGPASIYDFTVRVTDSAGAFVDLGFTITIF